MSNDRGAINFGLGAGTAIAALFLWLLAIDPTRHVRLLEVGLEVDARGARTLVGTAENRAGEPYARLELTIAFLDAGQRVVAWGTADTTDVPHQGRWTFRVPVPPGEVAGFHLPTSRASSASRAAAPFSERVGRASGTTSSSG